MGIYFLSLGLLLLGALLSIVVSEKWKIKVCTISSLLSTGLMLLPALAVLFTGMDVGQLVYMSPVVGYVDFRIDLLSAFFLVVISVMSFLGVFYANGYMKPYLQNF